MCNEKKSDVEEKTNGRILLTSKRKLKDEQEILED